MKQTQSHQAADARSGPRHSCQITDRAARSSKRSGHSWHCPPACPRLRSAVPAQTRRFLPGAEVRRPPQPQELIASTSAALDEGEVWKPAHRNAWLHHIHAVLESASQDPSHEIEWGWPILGIRDPVEPCLALEQKNSRTCQQHDLACRKGT